MPPRVLAELPDVLADLHAWGRAADGAWWALVAWSTHEPRSTGGHVPVLNSAWVPAVGVRASSYPTPQTYLGVVWLALPADPAMWPGLHVRPGHDYTHLGRLTRAIPRRRSHGSAYG